MSITILTRQNGIKVFDCSDYDSMITAAKTIVEEKTYAKVNGEALDSTTAGMLVAVHNALNESNREACHRMFQRILDQASAKNFPPAECRRLAMRKTVDLFWKQCR